MAGKDLGQDVWQLFEAAVDRLGAALDAVIPSEMTRLLDGLNEAEIGQVKGQLKGFKKGFL